MMDARKVAQIKACNGVYSLHATARFFGVSKSTVYKIWNGQIRKDVRPSETPDVPTKRVPRDVVLEDLQVILPDRPKVQEAAVRIGVSTSTLYRVCNEEGIDLAWFA